MQGDCIHLHFVCRDIDFLIPFSSVALSQSGNDSESQSESDYNFENYPNLSC